ncbi:ABC transporter substrate-binding protein [Mesorhizobium sp. YR577]|uniref:ABC transporter substrate-binding protein n=1 Tax=Mesorhizobium sp. YR577 TaxID=1884373 RepID=UPI0008EE3A7A|nr:ABC transporter substrate-binding protein [Mesorhizobium sp. YR577]SFU21747.1 amino acid ABC transporter substrate-binding protein, PAAT family [Mesorhizobium sp. YR577]
MNFTRRSILVASVAAGIAAMPVIALAEETLNVGSFSNNPPFEFKNQSGIFEGFEVDIVTEAAKRVGMTVSIEGYDFQPLFAATSSGRIDVAISSITITRERLVSQSFTQPYYDSGMGIAARADGVVNGLADLKGKTVGSHSGSTSHKWLTENKDKYEFSEVKGYNSQQDALLDLAAGRVDGVTSDVPNLEYAFTKMKGLRVVEQIRSGEQYGMMMTKNSPHLGKINDALSAMKKDGTMQAIHKKWFGTNAPDQSSTLQEAALPKG